MIKIPNENKKFSITNRSDVSGNIWYTKNINLSEEGYIKLSPRVAQFFSDSSLDTNFDTDFNLCNSIGSYGSSGAYYLATSEEPFKTTLSETSFSTIEDTDVNSPSMVAATRAKWWQNRWYTSLDTQLFYKTIATTAWTDTGLSLTTGIKHPIEVFRNKNSMCVGNGNTVKLIDTSHSTTITLTIPTDYEVVDISYSNNKVGITTKLSATAIGQNQEAFFFVWDGGTVSANAGYPMGTIAVASIVSYKSSWVILSKTGQLYYFNGGGFEEIAVFPFFTQDRIWDSSAMRGDVMIVEGDNILININGSLNTNGVKQELNIENFPGGVWCYDPKVGLYHKYSPSISQMAQISVADSDVNTTTDLLTATSGTIPITGSPIKLVFSTATPIGGLYGGQVYFVIKVSPTTFRLATSYLNAIAGTYINITSVGTSTNYFLVLNVKDYGQSFTTINGVLSLTDTKSVVYDGLIVSHRGTNTVGSQTNYIGITVFGFDNIGYFVTPKIESQEVEDLEQKLYLKYKPLNSTDTIKVKYKNEEILGIPVSTPMRGHSCIWTSPTTLTLVGDLSEVLTYLTDTNKECELEVISGSGAGQMSKISSISNNAGTYTITLEDTMEGVTASDTCNIKIDNWKTLYTITSGNTEGYAEIPIALTSKFIKFKVIMKGVGITIEELQVINKIHKPSV